MKCDIDVWKDDNITKKNNSAMLYGNHKNKITKNIFIKALKNNLLSENFMYSPIVINFTFYYAALFIRNNEYARKLIYFWIFSVFIKKKTSSTHSRPRANDF